jgi:hypothetical protein
MMRPPPGGTSPHKAHRSWPQKERICIACRGIIGGIGPSGATAAGGGAPPGGAAPGGGGPAPSAGGAPPPSPMASTALRHRGESATALTCRHRSAAAPLGLTPGQCTPKSERHTVRTAAICDWLAIPASLGLGLGGVSAGGVGPACAGSVGGAGGGPSAAGGAPAAGSGGLAAGAAAGTGAGSASSAAGFGPTASSAVLHGADTLPALRLRHCSASLPPGCTPAQCDMKSERQDWRIAAICSGDGCCAETSPNEPPSTTAAKIKAIDTPACSIFTVSLRMLQRHAAGSDYHRPACVVLPYCICFATSR